MIAGFLAVAALIILLDDDQLSPGQWAAALVIVLVIVLVIAVDLREWIRMSRRSVALPLEVIDKAKEALAGQVSSQSQAELALREVDDPGPIPIGWRTTGRRQAIDHSANASQTSLFACSADIADLAAKFRELDRRRLVILGGQGTGKTTLMVQLVRELTNTRDRYPDEPVPVLVSLADWNPSKCAELRDWLAVWLARDYPSLERDYPSLEGVTFSGDVAAALAAEGRILPVLDGFGELALPDRVAVINALNRSGGGEDGFILAGRTTEYVQAVQKAVGPLTGAVVIEPEPIGRTVAADYLKRCLPESLKPAWEPTLAALKSTGAPSASVALLSEVMATPLDLWLLRVAARGEHSDITPLLNTRACPDAEALRAYLFEELIPAKVSTRRTEGASAGRSRRRRPYGPHEFQRYLGYLAYRLANQPMHDGIRSPSDLVWWRLAQLDGTFTIKTRVFLASLSVCVYFPIFFVLTSIASPRSDPDPWARFLVAGPVALVAATMIGIAAGRWDRDNPGFVDFSVRRHIRLLAQCFWKKLPISLPIGLTVGLSIAVVTSRNVEEVSDSIIKGLIVLGLTVPLAWAFISFGMISKREGHTGTPMESWRLDRGWTVLRVLAPAVLFWSVLIVWALQRSRKDSVGEWLPTALRQSSVGFLVSLALALLIVLAFTRHRAWFAYITVSFRLARTRRLPRRLMRFLDDCHQLGLLRAVGPVYQFCHSGFQEHLAATYDAGNPTMGTAASRTWRKVLGFAHRR